MLSPILVLALGMVPQDPYLFEPAGKNFRVELPARPDRTSSRPVKNAAGVSQLTAAQARTGDATYSVQVTENHANVDPNTLDEGIHRFAAARKATLGAVTTISIGANPGRDFEISESTSEGPRRSKMRWVTSGNQLLMLTVAANPGRALPADADRFFDSIEIGGVKAPGAVARNEPVDTAVAEPAAPAVEAVVEFKPAPEVSAEPVADDEAKSKGTEAAKPSSKGTARKEPSKITLSPVPRNAKRYAADDVIDLPRSFLGADREGFRDLGPAGAPLVGVRVSYIEHFGGPKIRSAQPIYRDGAKHYAGQVHGQVAGPVTTAIARPGYAVGGLVTHAGLTVDGFRLVFMRVSGNRLDPDDSYNSPWLGDERGGGPGEVMSKGDLIIGLQGRAGPEVFALGLTSFKPSSTERGGDEVIVIGGGDPEPKEANPDVVELEPALKPSSKGTARKSSKITLSPVPRNAKRYAADDVIDLPRSFLGADREGFRDLGPAGAPLVGVRVSYIEHFGGPKIRSAQPIYRDGAKHYAGQVHGQVAGPVTTAIARPGYAVGGLVTHAGLTVDGFRLVFMRVSGNRLDPDDSYNSPWLGDERGGGPGEVMSKGDLIIGLQGRAGPEVFALGLTSLR